MELQPVYTRDNQKAEDEEKMVLSISDDGIILHQSLNVIFYAS